jgi:hypothetical protein
MRSTFSNSLLGRVVVAGASIALLPACASELTRTGSSPAFVIVDSMQGASGADPGTFGVPLLSDVVTLVDATVGGQTVRVPTIFNDLGQAEFRLGMKNPTSPTGPTDINSVTLNRYRVSFRRSDGRNTPGVDVPHGFDGGLTVTIPADGSATAAFEIVRHQAKQESPLANLAFGGGANIISTIAEITFYGRDQAGNEVTVTSSMTVNFGDFADPE